MDTALLIVALLLVVLWVELWPSPLERQARARQKAQNRASKDSLYGEDAK